MKTAVTVSLVSEARGGPFVFWDSLEIACREASRLGFDGIEIFAPSADAVDLGQLRTLLDTYQLQVAAVGTGAGKLIHGWTLSDSEAAIRDSAIEFVKSMIAFGAELGAPAIIGSMQGHYSQSHPKHDALRLLADSLATLGEFAVQFDLPLFYEPLNRYESNLANRLEDGTQLLRDAGQPNLKLLADLFHMNIEEQQLAEAIRGAAEAIGHVHFVDSNRRPAGCGHTRFEPIIEALNAIEYNGYLSAEAFPWPDEISAAEQTMRSLQSLGLR